MPLPVANGVPEVGVRIIAEDSLLVAVAVVNVNTLLIEVNCSEVE